MIVLCVDVHVVGVLMCWCGTISWCVDDCVGAWCLDVIMTLCWCCRVLVCVWCVPSVFMWSRNWFWHTRRRSFEVGRGVEQEGTRSVRDGASQCWRAVDFYAIYNIRRGKIRRKVSIHPTMKSFQKADPRFSHCKARNFDLWQSVARGEEVVVKACNSLSKDMVCGSSSKADSDRMFVWIFPIRCLYLNFLLSFLSSWSTNTVQHLCCASLTDPEILMTSGEDGRCCLWKSDGKLLHTIETSEAIFDIAWSHHSPSLFAGSTFSGEVSQFHLRFLVDWLNQHITSCQNFVRSHSN